MHSDTLCLQGIVSSINSEVAELLGAKPSVFAAMLPVAGSQAVCRCGVVQSQESAQRRI